MVVMEADRAWERVLAENSDQLWGCCFFVTWHFRRTRIPSVPPSPRDTKTAWKYVRGRQTLTRINRMLCFATGMYLFMGGGMNSISFMCLHCLTVGKLTELKSEYNVNAAGILWQRKWCVKDVLFVISLSWPTALLLGSHNMSLFLAFHQTIFCRSPSKVTLLLKIRAAASDCPTWRTVESVHRLCNERNRTSCPKVIFFKPKTCRYYNLPYQ